MWHSFVSLSDSTFETLVSGVLVVWLHNPVTMTAVLVVLMVMATWFWAELTGGWRGDGHSLGGDEPRPMRLRR